MPDFIPPLNENPPPSLFEDNNPLLQMAQAAMNRRRENAKPAAKGAEEAEKEPADPLIEQFKEFAKTVDQAGGQAEKYEDMRSDLVEQASRGAGFKESPIQGSPTDGHSVSVDLGQDEKASGEIFDRALDDLYALEQLEKAARPSTEELIRTLYPNFVSVPETVERIRSSGTLDPARLPLADVCPAVFRRYAVVQQADKRGQPVFVLICDFSGSLTADRVRMLKTLSYAWLTATTRRNIQVLAAVYNTDTIRQGLYGPLVQWLDDPRKTPATGRKEAAPAVPSLPDSGVGGQMDALSIAFIMNEAVALARGRRIYTVLITDCGWCNSFNTGKSAKDEVRPRLPHRLRRAGRPAARHPRGAGGVGGDRIRGRARQGDPGLVRRAEGPRGGRRQDRPLRRRLHEGTAENVHAQMTRRNHDQGTEE